MKHRISLRWRLILAAWLQAAAIAALIGVLLFAQSRQHLRNQLDSTLGTKADEVITILARPDAFRLLGDFFIIETKYRFSLSDYFYQISDETGQILARSENLGEFALPLPDAWPNDRSGTSIHFATMPHPRSPETHIRVRSEKIAPEGSAVAGQTLIIQTAASLDSLELAITRTYLEDLGVTVVALVAILLLLRYVTTRALRPVAAITSKASEISAKNLRERLPVSGNADELDELATVLNGMLDRLASSLRSTEGFSSNAAHQLRTRLTRIRGELDLVLRDAASGALRPALENMREELVKMSRLCSRLLLFSQLERHVDAHRDAGSNGIRIDQRVRLEDLVSELCEQLSPVAREHGIELCCGEAPAVEVRGNRALLVEALMNLLDNAIRFSRPGGSVELAVDVVGEDVRVSVADSGPGVSPDQREKIFERFYRGEPSSVDDDGSGLGLAIVRVIAQAHRGYVEVDDAAGDAGGAVFRLVLPVWSS